MTLKDVMGCVGAALLLLLASAWIPVFGPFISLLTPLPFLYYATKLGPIEGLKIVILSLLIVGLIATLSGFKHIIFFCLELGLLGLVVSELYRRELTFGLTIFWGTCFMLLIGACFLFLVGLSNRMGPLELAFSYFRENLNEAINVYRDMGLEPEQVNQLQAFVDLLTKIISKVYPSLLIIGTGLIVWANVMFSKPLFRIRDLRYPEFGPLDRWNAPEPMVWGVIAAGFALFLPIKGIKLLAINALIIMAVIYVFHGLSILLFFLNKYSISPWMRFLVYFLIVFQQIFLIGLALAGLFDQWLDIRKIYKKPEDKETEE